MQTLRCDEVTALKYSNRTVMILLQRVFVPNFGLLLSLSQCLSVSAWNWKVQTLRLVFCVVKAKSSIDRKTGAYASTIGVDAAVQFLVIVRKCLYIRAVFLYLLFTCLFGYTRRYETGVSPTIYSPAYTLFKPFSVETTKSRYVCVWLGSCWRVYCLWVWN